MLYELNKGEKSEKFDNLLAKEINTAKSILTTNLISLKEKSENDYLILENQLKFLEQKILNVPTTERGYAIALRNYNIQNNLYTFLEKFLFT